MSRRWHLMTPAQSDALRTGTLTAARAKPLIDDALSHEVDCPPASPPT
jgi:hypothetical protein